MRDWYKSGSPWIWLTAGAVALSILAVAGIMALTALRGLGHFWPKPVAETTFTERDGTKIGLIGEIREREEVAVRRLREAGFNIPGDAAFADRVLVKMGNRDVTGVDFRWFPVPLLGELTFPKDILTIERREWGNFYGHLVAVKESGQVVASGEAAWPELLKRYERAYELFDRIYRIEKNDIGRVNYGLEQLRLQARKLELRGQLTEDRKAEFETQRAALNGQFGQLQERLAALRAEIARDTVVGRLMDGKEVEVKLALVADVYRANDMSLVAKAGHYVKKVGEFIWDDPREANTEGGIFPAIFGTVLMVMLMAAMVTPLGIMAAIYMREYAKQGPLIRVIRVSVNNLAGVPSIVYGVFGLGFFVYFLGGNIDQLFFPEALPAPTFGSPGLLWASLTLAILTLPVVIVSTEEGLARVPPPRPRRCGARCCRWPARP